MSFNIEEANRLMRERRSIYPNMYSEEKVPTHIIEAMLENAGWAPNHGMTQPWRFTVFCDEGLEKLADFQSELYRKVTTEDGSFKQATLDKLQQKPLMASHIIALCMQRNPKEKVPAIEEVIAVACAVQNMYLTATAYGAGCYWTTGGITYMDEAKPFFQLGEKDRLLGFLYVGMPAGKLPQGKRDDIAEKVKWVKG